MRILYRIQTAIAFGCSDATSNMNLKFLICFFITFAV